MNDMNVADSKDYIKPCLDSGDTKKRWLKRVCCVKAAHYAASSRFERRHLILGFMLICVSAAVTVFGIVIALQPPGQELWMRYLAAALSGIATVLGGTQTFRRDAERAERHRKSGADHAYLEMRLERLMIYEGNRVDEEKKLRRLFEEWGRLTGGSPTIPHRLFLSMCGCNDNCVCTKETIKDSSLAQNSNSVPIVNSAGQ